MAFHNTTKYLTISVIAIVFVAGALLKNVTAQNCGCAPGLCFSQYGYCGTGKDYCSQGCQQGPCTGGGGTPTTPSTNVGSSVADIVTPEVFNGIISQASSDCAGKNFYSRGGFLDAVNSFSDFGRLGSVDTVNGKLQLSLLMSLMRLAKLTVFVLWYWMNSVLPVVSQGFGATTRAINGAVECDGKEPGKIQAQINYYNDYCNQLNVNPGGNLYC
ncbi:endochitinase PR4-like [Prunus dulcis]|uniref:endochitinase PR4-like n=1 Tax=Prunus dulcis TaxID=3755 RepID=UPI00148303E5|nr:endochitinase PR4-like [Prunus dulcis]